MLHTALDVLWACHRGVVVNGEGVCDVRSIPFTSAVASKEGASSSRWTDEGSLRHSDARRPAQ